MKNKIYSGLVGAAVIGITAFYPKAAMLFAIWMMVSIWIHILTNEDNGGKEDE